MTAIYLYTLLVSLLIPILYSIFFIDYIKYWKNFIISTSIIAIIYLVWDAIFTHFGIWGFSHQYCIGVYFFKLPIEEILFFFIIPFCSLFTHYAFFSVLSEAELRKNVTKWVLLITSILCILLILFNFDKLYTLFDFLFLLVVLLLGYKFHFKLLQQFLITFFIVLVPFFIVNGILTGILTETPIVWYNNNHNLGLIIFTIPVEDIGYAFSMLFGNLMIFSYLNNKKLSK